MTFLNPMLVLAGLACVAVPILVHLLLRRRRRPVSWGAMRFLIEALRRQRRRLRLEQFLLLAARCLVIVLVALALGRPMWGAASGLLGGSGLTLYLLVDDALPAAARDVDRPGTALDRHKALAMELLEVLDPATGDRAGLVSLAGPARAVVVPASPDISAVASLVRDLSPAESAADLPGALSILRETLTRSSGRTLLVVLSDFLAGSADLERRLPDLSGLGEVRLLATPPAPRGVENVTLTGLVPLRPLLLGGTDSSPLRTPVRVGLRRSGPAVGAPGVSTVRLTAGPVGSEAGLVTSRAVLRWTPGQETGEVTLDAEAPPGGAVVLTALVDDDALTPDNRWQQVVDRRVSLRVGIVATRRLTAPGGMAGVAGFEPQDWFRVALDPDRGSAGQGREVEVVEVEPASVDATRLGSLDALVVVRPDALSESGWSHVRALVDTGGLVVVTPPPSTAVHLWADAWTSALGLGWSVAREVTTFTEPMGLARPLLGDSSDLLAVLAPELPELLKPVRVWRVLRVEAPPDTPRMLSLADGTPFVLASSPGGSVGAGRGLVVYLAAPPHLDWTDLAARPLMVPLLQEIVRMGVARARGSWSAVAGSVPHLPPGTVELRAVSEGDVFLPAGEAVRRSGVFRALDERGLVRGVVTVNADPAAGRTEPQSSQGVQAWLGAAGLPVEWIEEDSVRPAREVLSRGGRESVRWTMILLTSALALAVVEVALGRWFSHAMGGRGR